MQAKNRDVLHRRRQFTRLFYHRNHGSLILAMAATLLGAGLNLALSWLLQQTLDLAAGTGATWTLRQLVLFALGLLACCVVIDAMSAYARPKFLSRAIAQYREYAYAELLKKNLTSFTRENTSVYLSALSNDANSIETNYLQKMFEFWGDAVLFAGALAMMFWYSVPLALVALVLSAVHEPSLFSLIIAAISIPFLLWGLLVNVLAEFIDHIFAKGFGRRVFIPSLPLMRDGTPVDITAAIRKVDGAARYRKWMEQKNLNKKMSSKNFY